MGTIPWQIGIETKERHLQLWAYEERNSNRKKGSVIF